METIHILLIEDNPGDARLIRGMLAEATGTPFDLVHVEQLCEGIERIAAKTAIDVVLLDLSLPDSQGLDTLARFCEHAPRLPIIILTGLTDEQVALSAVHGGAQDYLVKGQVDGVMLTRAIRYAIERKAVHESLRESESRYRLLADHMTDTVWLMDLDLRMTYISPSVEKLRGYTLAELQQLPLDRQLTPRSLQLAMEVFSQEMPKALADPTYPLKRMLEIEFYRKDGTTFWSENTFSLIRDASGKPVSILGEGRDISERKQAANQIKRQLERMSALHDIDMAITGATDVRIVLRTVLDHVVNQLGVDAAAILLLDADTPILQFAVGRGFHTSALQHTHLRLGDGYAGQAALEGRILQVPNLKEAPNGLTQSPLLAAEGFVFYCAAPLMSKGHTVGVLEVFRRTPLNADQEWLEFLEAICTQAAIAVDKAELFTNLQIAKDELYLAYETTLEGWSRAMDLRDRETEGHTQRVAEMATRLAKATNMSDEDLVHVRRGALLHDIGKVGIPDGVLLKPGPLSDDEWVVMRQHPVYAHQLLWPIAYLHRALDIPYSHHEKWDGTGYPQGLRDEQIPLAARVFAVVDVWDALRSDRPYRAAWSAEKARAYIAAQSGKHFDPQVVETFLSMLGRERSSGDGLSLGGGIQGVEAVAG